MLGRNDLEGEPGKCAEMPREDRSFQTAPCVAALLVIQSNVTLLFLAPIPIVPRLLPPFLVSGFAGALMFSILQPHLAERRIWLIAFLPFGVSVGLLRLALPGTSFLVRYGLPHMPLALVWGGVGSILGTRCGKRLVERGIRIRDGARFALLLVVLSIFTCYVYAFLIYVLSYRAVLYK